MDCCWLKGSQTLAVAYEDGQIVLWDCRSFDSSHSLSVSRLHKEPCLFLFFTSFITLHFFEQAHHWILEIMVWVFADQQAHLLLSFQLTHQPKNVLMLFIHTLWNVEG